MKTFLHNMIAKWPFKVLFITSVVVLGAIFFVPQITLSNGNETMIDPNSSTYEDNLEYQKTFGTDPIMIIYEGENRDDVLSYESIAVMNQLMEDIKPMDGVMHVNGIPGVIGYAVSESEDQYQEGLDQMSRALLTLSDNLSSMSLMDESQLTTMLSTFDDLKTAQEDISAGLDNQGGVMEQMKVVVNDEIARLETRKTSLDPATQEDEIMSLTQTIQILTNINESYTQLISMSDTFSDGTSQTALALGQIKQQLQTMFNTVSDMEGNIAELATNLHTMGINLAQLADHFNMFTGTFPEETSTLHQILYPEDGALNPMMETFLVDDNHVYMNIILEEGTSNEDIEALMNNINENLEGTLHEDSLVSGKPVLDHDIQTSMMDSMKIMMISAVVIMVIILLILFPVPLRVLPLATVLIAVAVTIGVMGLTGIPLTMVSMAVFPVLIGLGIDYSIQFHHRYTEELTHGGTHE